MFCQEIRSPVNFFRDQQKAHIPDPTLLKLVAAPSFQHEPLNQLPFAEFNFQL
ncbi:hypothetical protein AHAS_Ahas01G0293300 [Arachis hypogaea]